MSSRRSRLALPALLTVVAGLVPGDAAGQPAAKPAATKGAAPAKPAKVVKACGMTALPLAVGNRWTYEAVAHPQPLDPNQVKMLPAQARKVEIVVDAVETVEKLTTVKLTETVDGRAVATTITCTPAGASVSPDSFWFSGEPGAQYNLALDGVERPGSTLPLVAGKLSGSEWQDDLRATWKRTASEGSGADLGGGTLELKRRMVITEFDLDPAIDPDPMSTPLGTWRKAQITKLGIATSLEIKLAGVPDDTKPYVQDLVSFFYLVDGLGPIVVRNSFVQAFQLTAATIAK